MKFEKAAEEKRKIRNEANEERYSLREATNYKKEKATAFILTVLFKNILDRDMSLEHKLSQPNDVGSDDKTNANRTWKNHKYVDKIRSGAGWRYIYPEDMDKKRTDENIKAVTANAKKKVSNGSKTVKNMITNVGSQLKETTGIADSRVSQYSDFITQKTLEFISKFTGGLNI